MSGQSHPPACPQCGNPAGPALCEELFSALLALDHSRRPPWGPLHTVVVACFFLQHPAHPQAPAANDRNMAVLHAYRDGGIRAVEALVRSARRANSHRSGRRAIRAEHLPPSPREDSPPVGFVVTIADVAADGLFPAEGHEARVRVWVDATLSTASGRP